MTFDPCHCIDSHRLRHDLSGTLGWYLTVAQVGRAGYSQQATPLHPRVFLGPFLFTVLNLLHLSFSPIGPPHTCTLWWFQLQASYMADGPLGDILHPRCMSCQQVNIYVLPVLRVGLSTTYLRVGGIGL